jgi:hypothetical protein
MSPQMPSHITTLGLPLPLTDLGFNEPFTAGTTTLIRTDGPQWSWHGESPGFDIPACEPAEGVPVGGWTTDHIVLLVPDLESADRVLGAVGARARLRIEVKGRPTAFYRVGTVLEVIESPVRAPSIFGVALSTEESLEVVALRWRSRGFDVTDPKPAIQPGRRIATVRGLDTGFAVMSRDREIEPPSRHSRRTRRPNS